MIYRSFEIFILPFYALQLLNVENVYVETVIHHVYLFVENYGSPTSTSFSVHNLFLHPME